MPAHKIILVRSWKHPYKLRPYPIGTILLCDNELASELLTEEFGEIYTGQYPPADKTKTDFFKPKGK